MNALDRLRYSKWFSRFVRPPFKILHAALTFAAVQIQRKVKINTGEITYYGFKLKYPKDVGVGVLSNLFWKGERGFEAETARVLIALFKKSDAFFDVGSNYGFYSVLAKKVNPLVSVVAFEPNHLMACQNRLFSKVNDVEYELIKKGLGDVSSERELFVPAREGAKEITTSSFREDFFFNKDLEKRSVKVECITFDDFWKSHSPDGTAIPRNTCFKIDVEGYEINVLKGCEKLLKLLRPAVVCEVDNRSAGSESPLQYLNARGYAVFNIQTLGLVRLGVADFDSDFGKEKNFLFYPAERTDDRVFISYKYLDSLIK